MPFFTMNVNMDYFDDKINPQLNYLVGLFFWNGFTNIIAIRIGYYCIQFVRVHTSKYQIKSTACGNKKPEIGNATLATVRKSDNDNCIYKCCSSPQWLNMNQIGSPRRLATLFVVVSIFDLFITCIIISVGDSFSNNTGRIEQARSHLLIRIYILIKSTIIATVVGSAARNRAFKFEDHWHISKEFKTLSKCWLIHLCIAIIAAIVTAIIPSKMTNSSLIVDVLSFIFAANAVIVFIEPGYVSVVLVIKWNGNSDDVSKKQIQIATALSNHVKDNISGKETAIEWQLADFWDPSQMRQEMCSRFMQFRDHCVRELSAENLMFWIEGVQLSQFLITNGYIIYINNGGNKDNIPNVVDKIAPFRVYNSTTHLGLEDTESICALKLRYEQRKRRTKIIILQYENENNKMVDNSNDPMEYDIFKPYYVQLYKKFFQRGVAPFELNIPYEMSIQLSKYYSTLLDGTNMTKDYFDQNIWEGIRLTATEIYPLLWSSFQRYRFVKSN